MTATVATTTFAALITLFVMTVMASSSTTASCQLLNHLINLRLSGITVFQHRSSKKENLSCQRMVCIYCDTICFNLCYGSHELMALYI